MISRPDILDRPTGGAAAIHGFLYQILASAARLIEAVTAASDTGDDVDTITAILEPRLGGDFELHGRNRVCVQFKHRSAAIGGGDLADSILVDLFRAHLGSPCDRYQLQATIGLTAPARKLMERLAGSVDQEEGTEALLDRARLACRTVFEAQQPPKMEDFDKTFGAFASCVEVGPILDSAAVHAQLGGWLQQRLPYAERINDEIDRLTGHLLARSARNGSVLSGGDILELLRLTSVTVSTPEEARRHVSERLERAVREHGFDVAQDVRPAIRPSEDDPLTLVTGASGRGKTWSLCRIAGELSAEGVPVILISAPSLKSLYDMLNRQIVIEALGHESPISSSAIGRVWRRFHQDPSAYLWVIWEGCGDPAELEEVQLGGGLGEGLRLVAELPPGTQITGTRLATVPSYPLQDFTEAEVFEALRRRNIDAGLIPHMIRRMLRLPVLCGIYASLAAEIPNWNPTNEYLVLEKYWSRARQPVNPFAHRHLKALAERLLEKRRSRLNDEDLIAADIEEQGLSALVKAGWLAYIDAKWSFAHDRLLTWALAERLVDRFEAGTIESTDLADVIRDLTRRDDDKLRLQGLGFLLMDVVWLVLSNDSLQRRIGELLAALERDNEVSGKTLYRELLPTVGALTATAVLSRLRIEAEGPINHDLTSNLVAGLVRSGLNDVERAELIVRLASIQNPSSEMVLLLIGADWPLHAQRDTLWADYVSGSQAKRSAGFDFNYFSKLEAALLTIARDTPVWLCSKLEANNDGEELWLAAQLLRCLPHDVGLPLWRECAGHLVELLPEERYGILINCIGHFRDVSRCALLASLCQTSEAHGRAALAELVFLAPSQALAVISNSPPLRRRPDGRLWLDSLLDHDRGASLDKISTWMITSDPTGREFAMTWALVPERLEAGIVEQLLGLVDVRCCDTINFDDKATVALLKLLGHRHLPPRFASIFEHWRESSLAAQLLDYASSTGDDGLDLAGACRRVLRRIGGERYAAFLEQLLAVPLDKALDGIHSSVFQPSTSILKRLESFADNWDTPCDSDVRIELWRALLALHPARWYPRTVALLAEKDAIKIHLGITLLREGGFDDVEADVLACVARSEMGSQTEALAINFALEIGNGDSQLFERGRQRFQMLDDSDEGQLASFNAMLKDRSAEGRAILDPYLLELTVAKSYRSTEISLLACRLRQEDVSKELLRAGERMMHRRTFFGESIVDAYIERRPDAARNVLLEQAFAPAGMYTNAQPDAIELLSRLDVELAVQAFAQAWRDRADRREYLGAIARFIGPRSLPCLIEHLHEDVSGNHSSFGFRRACLELRRHNESAAPLLKAAFAEAGVERKLALVEAIGWLPDSADWLMQIEANDPETIVRRKSYEVRLSWIKQRWAIEHFSANPAELDAMEYMIDLIDPAILCDFKDEWAAVPLIQQDPRLTMFAEVQLARRYNDVSKSRLKRVRLRPRDRPANAMAL